MINKLDQKRLGTSCDTNTTEDNRGYQAKKTVLATIDFPFLNDDNTILNCIHCSHSDKDYIVATTRLSNTQVFVGQIISNQNDDNDQDSIPDVQIKTLGQYPLGNAYSKIFPLITEKSFLITGENLHEGGDLHKVDLETGTILWSVKTISRRQRFVEDERGIIYSVPDCGDYIYLMDTRTGQLLDKRKLKVSNSLTLTYGLAYDILNCNLILSTNVFGKNYWYTSFHLSRQMKIERKTLHSQVPNLLDFDIYKKKIFSMQINPSFVECYDLDYKEKVTIQTHALGNPISFFLFKDCKYLAIITGKQLIVMN